MASSEDIDIADFFEEAAFGVYPDDMILVHIAAMFEEETPIEEAVQAVGVAASQEGQVAEEASVGVETSSEEASAAEASVEEAAAEEASAEEASSEEASAENASAKEASGVRKDNSGVEEESSDVKDEASEGSDVDKQASGDGEAQPSLAAADEQPPADAPSRRRMFSRPRAQQPAWMRKRRPTSPSPERSYLMTTSFSPDRVSLSPERRRLVASRRRREQDMGSPPSPQPSACCQPPRELHAFRATHARPAPPPLPPRSPPRAVRVRVPQLPPRSPPARSPPRAASRKRPLLPLVLDRETLLREPLRHPQIIRGILANPHQPIPPAPRRRYPMVVSFNRDAVPRSPELSPTIHPSRRQGMNASSFPLPGLLERIRQQGMWRVPLRRPNSDTDSDDDSD